MKEAIQKAIEGGYKPMFYSERKEVLYRNTPNGVTLRGIAKDLSIHQALLDPLFWQCLGKALGWGETTFEVIGDENSTSIMLSNAIKASKERAGAYQMWLYHWHRFIDHLAEGKDVDEFFKELIK